MKKFFVIFLFFMIQNSFAFSLKGSVNHEFIPEGFFGSWVVLSKLNSTNNPSLFKAQSKDIWTLSGFDKTLVLQNFATGARSEIDIKEKSTITKNGSTLKFKRTSTKERENLKIVYKETISFTLLDNKFKGFDNYIVEKYEKGKMIEKNQARYFVAGVKIE